MDTSQLIASILILVTTGWSLAAIFALWKARRRGSIATRSETQVSVLKPLCGVDEDLETNLRSFFVQRHASYELIFGVEGERDPAIAVARKLCAEYPHIPSKVVVHRGGFGINPKMSNLRAMLAHASHDVVVVSDSNIRVGADYLSELAVALDEKDVGLVTSLFAGVGEKSIGATLENLHLNGTVVSAIAISTELLDHPAVVGKSMMFRRSVIDRLGGFTTVKDVLAEDYVIGRMFHEAGYKVRLTKTPIHNVVRTASVETFFARHVRWGMIRVRLVPLAFALEPLSIPLVVAAIAITLGLPALATLAWAASLTLVRDSITWTMLRGSRGLLRALPLAFIRDLAILAAWMTVPFSRHVTWRGKRVRVSAGTRLYRELA